MKDLTKYFIDLSKCSEEQIEEVLRVLEQARQLVRDDIINKRFHNSFMLLTKDNQGEWHGDNAYNLGCKTELTYPEFIKLFEDGEGENKVLQVENILKYLSNRNNELSKEPCFENVCRMAEINRITQMIKTNNQ